MLIEHHRGQRTTSHKANENQSRALLARSFIRDINGWQPRFRSPQTDVDAILDIFSMEKCLSKLNQSLKFK